MPKTTWTNRYRIFVYGLDNGVPQNRKEQREKLELYVTFVFEYIRKFIMNFNSKCYSQAYTWLFRLFYYIYFFPVVRLDTLFPLAHCSDKITCYRISFFLSFWIGFSHSPNTLSSRFLSFSIVSFVICMFGCACTRAKRQLARNEQTLQYVFTATQKKECSAL